MKMNIVISMRITDEMAMMIAFLKSKNVRTKDVIRNASIIALKEKCDEFNHKPKKEYCPF